ncbi:MAG: hypothetical protein H6835_07100 [Planctomycetes bacterium]|nr:hypothetical protein [Planctomycetota bacterium]
MSTRTTLTPWILAAWFGLAGAGAWQLVEHATAAGTVGAVPQQLTRDQVAALRWQGNRPLLVVAAHPQCPCLPSTLDGLARVLTEHPEVELRVLVYTPSKRPPSWDEAQSRTLCDGLPDGAVVRDRDGQLAASLGAETSGHVSLYAPVGALAFAGGITQGRGHTGANQAERALLRALDAASPRRGTSSSEQPETTTSGPAVQTAVFGCPLTDAPSTCNECRSD